jgi:type I restriction enzyme S subunit
MVVMKMPKYRFEDIAFNITQKRKPTSDDMKTYIGLEHLDSGSLSVTRWGSNVPIKGDKLLMQKGDILFGKRNAYLRRAAIAPHDGLFSAHGMILRPNEKVISRKLFPFFICSDYFFDAAIRISVGSLSPTINWSALKELEFILPNMYEQEKLAELLWAANDTKEAYKKLLYLTDELVKSQFIEMFGDPNKNPFNWEISPVEEWVKRDFIERPMDGNHGGKHPRATDYVSSGVPFIMANNLIDGRVDYHSCNYLTEPQANSLDKGFAKAGDVLITHKGTIGRTAIVDNKFDFIMLTPQVTYYRILKGLNNIYLKAYFDSYYFQTEMFKIAGSGTTRAYIGITAQKKLPLIVPPIELQNKFADFVQQSDESKFELKQNIDNLETTIKALMMKNLG